MMISQSKTVRKVISSEVSDCQFKRRRYPMISAPCIFYGPEKIKLGGDRKNTNHLAFFAKS
jgi:hypothetical protein